MLEILLIAALWSRMGSMMKDRGYPKPLGFQILVPICWLGAEFAVGFAIGFMRALHPESKDVSGVDWQPYVGSLLGAALCTGVLFFVASNFRKEASDLPPSLPGQ